MTFPVGAVHHHPHQHTTSRCARFLLSRQAACTALVAGYWVESAEESTRDGRLVVSGW